MTTLRQIEANRSNGCLSRGPRTEEGKAIASRNAVRHGATATALVLPGVESEADWLGHLDGIHAALGPQGALETFLADRVAVCAWRLGRIVRYETAMAADALHAVEDDERLREGEGGFHDSLPDSIKDAEQMAIAHQQTAEQHETDAASLEEFGAFADDHRLSGKDAEAILDWLGWKVDSRTFGAEHLAPLGIGPRDIRSWEGWKVGLVWEAAAYAATTGKFGESPRDRLARMIRRERGKAAEQREKAEAANAEAAELKAKLVALRRHVVHERLLPDDVTLQRVARHESHLTRQMNQALHELHRLQAARAGDHVQVPIAVDVTLSGAGE